ncbi:MAG: pyridoxal-dependent decarboxylase [Kofleriaceae bacterium]
MTDAAHARLPPVPELLARAYAPASFAADGRRVIEALAGGLAEVAGRERAQVSTTASTAALREAYPATFAEHGHGDLVGELARAVDGSIRLHHPRVFGHQVAPPLPGAALAELTSALLNNGMAITEMGPAASAMEHAVIGWMAAQLGWAEGAGGVLTSGGSLGNLTALLAARQARAGYDAWTEPTAAGPPLAVLTSADAHYSVARAVRILGWGDAGVVPVAIDARHRLRPRALDDAAAAAAAAGVRVVAIVAAAGSTATGAFDPLDEIAAIAAARGLWLHVDGAHGASVALSSHHRARLRGIERADSVVWDAHKLLLMPAMATAVLYRDARAGRGAFAQQAAYLFGADAGGDDATWEIGRGTFECTKRMIALALHATLRTHGVALWRAAIDRVMAAAAAFAERIERAPDFGAGAGAREQHRLLPTPAAGRRRSHAGGARRPPARAARARDRVGALLRGDHPLADRRVPTLGADEPAGRGRRPRRRARRAAGGRARRAAVAARRRQRDATRRSRMACSRVSRRARSELRGSR